MSDKSKEDLAAITALDRVIAKLNQQVADLRAKIETLLVAKQCLQQDAEDTVTPNAPTSTQEPVIAPNKWTDDAEQVARGFYKPFKMLNIFEELQAMGHEVKTGDVSSWLSRVGKQNTWLRPEGTKKGYWVVVREDENDSQQGGDSMSG